MQNAATFPQTALNPKDQVGRLSVTPAKRSDAKMVAEIVRSSASWYAPILEPEDMREHAVDELWALRNFGIRDFYVGRDEGKPVGILSMQYTGDYAYMGYLYLYENVVGKGYGQEFQRFAAYEARRRGKTAMMLIAHPEAKWAMRAYKKFGFRVIARERDDVLAWNDGWLKPYYEEGFVLHQYDL